MSIQKLKKEHTLLLEVISGSKAYGLDSPQSDLDIKGVYAIAKKDFYGLSYPSQVNNASNDEMYYELGKFFDLLAKNNPNILELLATPKESILHKHSIIDCLKPELFLSKLCKDSFAGYAMTQLKKARGLNKKILNPMDQQQKSIEDFCYVGHNKGSLPLMKYLALNLIKSKDTGLVKVNHMKDMYYLYADPRAEYRGIATDNSNDIRLSSVSKDALPIALVHFNKDGYSRYCKDYKAYWNWVDQRNEIRYQDTLDHGKNYDAKNMMHTFRLLRMAEEIAKEGILHVHRKDRDELLKIKAGFYSYDDLLKMAEDQLATVKEAFDCSDLPDRPDEGKIQDLLVEIREELYV